MSRDRRPTKPDPATAAQPDYGKPIGVRLPGDVKAVIDRLAKAERRTVNQQIVALIDEALRARGVAP